MILRFRCYHKLDGVMYSVVELFNGQPSVIKHPRGDQRLLSTDQAVKICITMQWTTCRDSKQNDIYEGDVVSCRGARRIGQVGTVEFMEACWVVNFSEPDENGAFMDMLSPMAKEVEVVGNIHQKS